MPRLTLDDVLNDEDDLGLLEIKPLKTVRTPAEDRAITGLEEINRFLDEHGHRPTTDYGATSQEKQLARRLNALRSNAEIREVLRPHDRHGVLGGDEQGLTGRSGLDVVLSDPDLQAGERAAVVAGFSRPSGLAEPAAPFVHHPKPEPETLDDVLDDDELDAGEDVFDLRHVTPAAERDQPEYVARQKPCEDFNEFKPLFEIGTKDLETGRRQTRDFKKGSEIQAGHMFIVRGLMAYIAERTGDFYDKKRNPNARLRVIYSNGTESDMLLRSFSSALYNDPHGRRITDPSDGPVFGGEPEDDDVGTGTVYVLKSLSDDPEIKPHRAYLHKIGVTSGNVERRLTGVEHDPTFLMAPVEVVATYTLYNIKRSRLEHLLHAYFDAARADVEVKDRFGQTIRPREWFFVPLDVIREALQRLAGGTLSDSYYDPSKGRILDEGGS